MAIDQLVAPSAGEVLSRIEEDGVGLVNLQFVDITGTLKSVIIPAAQLPGVIEQGKWFDGSAIEGFARIAESDMYLWPDLSTYALIPWKTEPQRTARLLCWVRTPDGEPFPGDPRTALARVIRQARDAGYAFSTAVELEFYLLPEREPVTPRAAPRGEAGYFGVSPNREEELVEAAVMTLRRMGAAGVSYHHEVAPGQHEVDLEAEDALRSADTSITLKYVLRALGRQHGLRVTFMPKPWEGLNGSGMHTLQRVSPQASPASSLDEYGLSDDAHAFIAGQLHHGRGLCALIAPLVNSYKRFVPGYEAPIYLSWARHNRGAFIRVPQTTEGESFELRAPDSSCNPYLAFAAMQACGLDGIRRGLSLLPPVEETLYGYDSEIMRRQSGAAIPASLGEALGAMEADSTVQEAIGEYLSSRFLEMKSLEWQAYLQHVDSWELDRYLDTA